jgi:hypothetical protein
MVAAHHPMNSTVARSLTFAALLSAPLAGICQIMHTQAGAGNGGTAHLTLLTGPTLTSPAGQRTLTPNGWVTPVRADVVAGETKTFTAAEVAAIEKEMRETQAQLEAATEKLNRLQNERAALLAKSKAAADRPIGGAATKPDDWLHFDFRAPPAPPSSLPRPSTKPTGEIKFSRP